MVKADAPTLVLDVATGTADLAIALAKGTGADITGADISEGMLEFKVTSSINQKQLSIFKWF